jgi:hypothetical protein
MSKPVANLPAPTQERGGCAARNERFPQQFALTNRYGRRSSVHHIRLFVTERIRAGELIKVDGDGGVVTLAGSCGSNGPALF